MAGHLAHLRRHDAPAISTDALRAHLTQLAQLRGAAPWFDRFESQTTHSTVRLQLEVIRVDRDAPTLVFMPGTNAYTLLYGELLCALADRGYNIVGFDPRGHGRSGGRRGSYTIPDLVDDFDAVVAWARATFDGPVIGMGSSQGGITAFYAASGGSAVDGIICHNLADLADPRAADLTRAPRLSRLMAGTLHRLARWLPEVPVPMSAYLDLAREPVEGIGTAKDVLLSDPLTVPFVRLKTLSSLGKTPLPAPLSAFDTPILVLQAGADAIFPTAYIQDLVDQLPGDATLKIYPGLPHYFFVDQVPAFIDDVHTWLERWR
jgi:alpha-beta hydrolase superfamily lysophospholipase